MATFDVPKDIAENVICKHIWDAAHEEGGNQIILVNGLPRTGKSEACLALCHKLYRGTTKDFEHKFEVPKHIAWSKLDYQKIVRGHKSVGACLMWDEAGIAELGAHARQFWSESNIRMSTLFQIMGFHQQISFINLPMKMMLDKHLRSLSHVVIDTIKVKKRFNRCVMKCWWLEMTSRYADPLSKYPRFKGLNRFIYRVKTIRMNRAPKGIRDEYIEYSHVFKEWLERKLIVEEELMQVKEEPVNMTNRLKQIFEKIKKNPEPYLSKKNKETLDINAIRFLEGLNRQNAYAIRGWWPRRIR